MNNLIIKNIRDNNNKHKTIIFKTNNKIKNKKLKQDIYSIFVNHENFTKYKNMTNIDKEYLFYALQFTELKQCEYNNNHINYKYIDGSGSGTLEKNEIIIMEV